MVVRMLIFEKDLGFRNALSAQIANTEGYWLLGAFADTRKAEKQLRRLKPHLILLDVDLLAEYRTTVRARKVRALPPVDLLILTRDDLDERVLEAIGAGASGYLLKKIPPERILNAIRAVYDASLPVV